MITIVLTTDAISRMAELLGPLVAGGTIQTIHIVRDDDLKQMRPDAGRRRMPGKAVKNWPQYEKLRGKGMSKTSAAKITNAAAAKKKKK